MVTDQAILALHKYYLRAEYMRSLFQQARERLVAKHGVEALKVRKASTERFQVEMFLDYWYAGIWAVMEGYEKLGLTDRDVETLLHDSLYNKLREYRAGTYHFRGKYFDDGIRALIDDPNSAEWMAKLDMALGRYLIKELAMRNARRTKAASEPEVES